MNKIKVIVFAIFTVLMAYGLNHQVSAEIDKRVYHVSLVAKDSVNKFYNRLSNQNSHLVVTSEKPLNAILSKKFTISEKEELLIIEPQNGDPQSIEGSQDSIGRFGIVVLPNWGKAEHFHFGSASNYVEMAKRIEKEYPQKPSLFASTSKDRTVFDFPEVDQNYLKDKIEEFSGETEFVLAGQTERINERGSINGRKLARAWLKQQYEALGFVVREHTDGRNINFIAERPGKDNSKYLILSSHLDSVRNAGADDNGTGTVSALAIANELKNFDLEYGLKIIGFDLEELGLLGSAAYAKKLHEDSSFSGLIGVVNMEMTAYDADGDFAYHVIDCNENSSDTLSQVMEDAVAQLNLDLRKVKACTNRSDHASFWRYDQPAIVISQNFFGGDSNPCYHKSCDKVDRLNFDYMAQLTQAIGATVATLVEAH